jgi:hypothetical protein
MARSDESWYDRQALFSKLITYAAILLFLGCWGWAIYVWYKANDYQTAVFFCMAGIGVPAFLIGISAIIDLLIVNAEALRTSRK